MLGITIEQAAKTAKVAKQTLADFEREARTPYDRTLEAIREAYEAAGLRFTDDGGVAPK